MLVVLAIAAAVIMVGVVVVAVGRGGEMAYFPSDYAPLDLGVVAATDVVLLRPPTSLWGYNIQVTDEALNRITHALSQRDIRIASLEQQVAYLRAEQDTSPASPPQPASADVRAARWEIRADGWDAATSDQRTGTDEFTGREAVPVTRPQPAVPAAGPEGRTERSAAMSPVDAATPVEGTARAEARPPTAEGARGEGATRGKDQSPRQVTSPVEGSSPAKGSSAEADISPADEDTAGSGD